MSCWNFGGARIARTDSGIRGAGAVTMGPMSDAQQRVRELFDAHFTIGEIVERTALEIQTVVRLLNAPRAIKRRSGPLELAEIQSPRLGG